VRHIAIVGLGLIGASFGLALRRLDPHQAIWGYDLAPAAMERARQRGAITRPCATAGEAVDGAALIIVATPAGAMHDLLRHIAPHLAADAVVTDVASTKARVVAWAEEALPRHASFIGGHPLTGKETSGPDAADGELFRGCVYCLTPTVHTSHTAIEMLTTLIQRLGARILFLDPAEHDGLVAGISHLPFLLATALMNTVADSATWPDMAVLAAGGFRDTTRLASGNAEMYRDICLTNRDAIVQWLDRYTRTLLMLRDRIARHDERIEDEFARARTARASWLRDRESRNSG